MHHGEWTIRPFLATDSVEQLTELLHRAYRPLLDQGWRYLATTQTPEITRQRMAKGTCFLAAVGDRVVGTITYRFPTTWVGWFNQPFVASVGQFAVEPEWQARGIGSALLGHTEAIAWNDGAKELALSTAEPAAHLIAYYAKRGYRVVEHTDETLPNGYRSVILSKTLTGSTQVVEYLIS